MKLMMFGIDGFSYWVARVDPGRYPTLARLTEEGNYALSCVGMPVTWEAWTTIVTGLLPYHHGIRVATTPEAGLLSRAQATYKQAMWDAFNNVGWSVGVTNFPPMAYPAQGCVRNGWCMTDALNYPTEVYDSEAGDISKLAKKAEFDDYWQLGIMLLGENQSGAQLRLAQERTIRCMKIERQRVFDNMMKIYDARPVDVLLHYQHDLDFLQHYTLGTDHNAVLEAYDWYDQALKIMMDKFRPETVVVVSDHGQMALTMENNAAAERVPWPGNAHREHGGFWMEKRGPYTNFVSGTHTHFATALFWGDGVTKSDTLINDMALEDIMPTALGAKMIQPPPDLDGRVRYDVLGSDQQHNQPQVVADRLADLGYEDAPPGIGMRDAPRGVVS